MRWLNSFILVLFVLAIAAPAVAHPTREAKRPCHYHWWNGLEQKKNVVRCWGDKINPPGGWRKAWRVESCESGHNPYFKDDTYRTAYSHNWQGYKARVRAFLYARWAQVRAIKQWWDYSLQQMVTMRWAKAQGRWSGTDMFPVCGLR